MNHASETCAECDRLSAEYESATIRWFRLDSQMQIAEFGLDKEASLRIARELYGLGEERAVLRESLMSHVSQRHGMPGSLTKAAA